MQHSAASIPPLHARCDARCVATARRSTSATNGLNRAAAPAPDASPFCAEVIRSPAALRALAGEWDALLEQSAARTIFLTWDWIGAWLDAVRPHARLHVVVIRDAEQRIAAIGPFYQTRVYLLGALPFRCLRVLGDAGTGAEYGNIIARADVANAATAEVLRHLARRSATWDAIWLPNMGPSPAPGEQLLALARQAGLLCRAREAEFSRIALPATFERYLESLPRKVRYQVRRGMERVREQFGVELREVRAENLDQALDDLFRLHAARWTARGKTGAFARGSLRAFYRALAARLLPRGRLRLDRALVGGRAVAAQIGLTYGDVFSELQRGFDPSFPNVPAGLGAALRSMVMARSIREGVRTYDFLGGFSEHKSRAGAQRTCGRDVLIVRPAPLNRLLHYSRTWPTGRYQVCKDD